MFACTSLAINFVISDLVRVPQSMFGKCLTPRIARKNGSHAKTCKTPIYRGRPPVDGSFAAVETSHVGVRVLFRSPCISGNCMPSFPDLVYAFILMLGGEGPRDA